MLAVEINPLASRSVFACIFGRSEPKSIMPALFFFHPSTSFFYLFVFNRSSKTTLKPLGGRATPVSEQAFFGTYVSFKMFVSASFAFASE